MQRSLQVQILAWLAALSILGAATRPSFDTILFATAFVVGTLMMSVRERLKPAESRTIGQPKHLVGRILGASLAWAAVGMRHGTSLSASFPTRLSTSMLIAAAVIPSGIVVLEGVLMLLARREKSRAAREEA